MKELLTIDDISVSYGNIKALQHVSMHVNEGNIVCLIGANGSGKSTLLKAIVGQEPLVGGSITFDGEEICRAKTEVVKGEKRGRYLTTDLIAAKGIALVPEGRRVFADMTVEENLDMGAFLVRDENLIAERKEAMYDFFPILGARRRQKTRSLSGGEQQMMAIARALMSGPRLILLDEPGLGLAPLVIADIFEKIDMINKQDKVTVFLVEQNARMALKASTEGYVMENGRIVLHDVSSALLENEQVRAAYLGE
ncbi:MULTISPECIES: ABC transporter ATP-binding protein [Sphaerochaeta]|jgi:branched-chain amino acid transport system ATP-binding protein|uniref:ABC transporter ATP-binding protein n=2 Tax=root TaxID=1 RepID=A0ABY4D802_9SPIR|nr:MULTISPECIES: ABC transporter ATP-binding protein [Sphaerochaeta]MDT3359134.1 ABC transporter ATP-binding protein [Spirochaetota bacterium]MDD3423226.1 ABC transporter ATP-binding protein [Sphaerochaeta sp.]MDD3455542.1 ABC transporter ATP-binding protein [Sphaerochaeta sp.]MDD4449179.1 ABC transporter ATP-binding protein [Sphaerochaeta sp.]MEA5027523.1 ABC transporter ATP-binding protein [Sphaerochaeta associata]